MAYLACEDVNDLIFACLSPLMVSTVLIIRGGPGMERGNQSRPSEIKKN